MFKNFVAALVVLLVAVSVSQAQDQPTTKGWFDMDNCEICQHMSDHKDLMTKVKWETHVINNGLLSITVVPEDAKKRMAKVKTAMDKEIEKLKSGQKMKCCGFCTSFGNLLAEGAQMQELETVGGTVMLLTSKQPDMVKAIHKHAKTSIAAHKEMKEEMKKQKGSSADTK